MEGKDFVLPGTERVPSVFAAGSLFFSAVAGKFTLSYLTRGIQQLLSYLALGADETVSSSAAAILYYCLFILLPFIVYARKKPGIGEYIRIRPLNGRSFVLCALSGITGFFLCTGLDYFWCMGIEALGGTIAANPLSRFDGAGKALLLLFSTALMPAVCEEILCRGALLSAWEEKGSRKAILISALLFTLMHSSIAGIPVEFLSGLTLAFIVVACDSLFAGIIYHVTHNTMALMMGNLFTGGAVYSASDRFEAAGGAKGCAVLVLVTVMLGLATWLLVRRLRKINCPGTFGKPAIPGPEKSVYDYAVIICGIIAALALYVYDLLRITGVTK